MRQTISRRSLVGLCGAVVGVCAAVGLVVRPAASPHLVAPQESLASTPVLDRVLVRLNLLGTPPDRATGTTETMVQSAMGPGDRRTWFLAAGTELTGNLCRAAVGIAEPTQAAVRWRVEVEVVEASAGRVTLAVSWARGRWRAGAVTDEAVGRRTVQLDVGQHQVLDYLPDPTSSVCANVVLQVMVDAVPAPQPQATLLYDLWLEYNGRLGHRWEHQQLTAHSGVQTPFRFDAMEWALEQSARDVAVSPLRLEVTGTVLGRLRDDGFVEVALRAHRQLSWVGSGVGGDGQLDYRAALGEAAGVLLPEPSSGFRRPYPPQAAIVAPGASFRDGMWELNLKQFLDGTVTLHVVVTRKP